jgi:DNA helicase-2/ATP-dependent DNA helicase PcrA
MDLDVTETDYITLMSTHAAKGLEFKSVFIVGMEENLFPSYMSMSSPDQIDEERRLFYVALTRAKQKVTITYCNSRYQFGQMRFNDPSRFLEELPENIIENTSNIKQVSGSIGLGQPKLLGNFKQLEPKTVVTSLAMKDFKASPSTAIEQGMQVLHMKFGQGKVLKVDGSRDNRVATIHFSDIANPEKRIMLRFAKLQILS